MTSQSNQITGLCKVCWRVYTTLDDKEKTVCRYCGHDNINNMSCMQAKEVTATDETESQEGGTK